MADAQHEQGNEAQFLTSEAMNSKRKGTRGENELARWLTAHGFPAKQNEQCYTGGRGNPDVTADGLESDHFEVKRVERLNISEAMRQAEADGNGHIPAVVHCRNREPWLITLRLEDWLADERRRRGID